MENTTRAIIFDLDGTLVHTKPEYRYLTVGKTLKELCIGYSEPLIDRFWFEGDRDSLIEEKFKIKPKLFWETFHKYDIPELRAKFTETFSDIDYLNELKGLGYKTGIVTGAPIKIANLEIGLIGADKFDAIVIAHKTNGFIPKPHPHGVLECLSMMGEKNKRTIGVGNSDEDIDAFKAAKVFDVFIDRKEHTYPLIPATVTIESLYEIRNILKMRGEDY